MSNKLTKRGKSLYIESWNPRSKRFINKCIQCGAEGYKPSILEDGFDDDLERSAIKRSLIKTLKPLDLDDFGYCEICSGVLHER